VSGSAEKLIKDPSEVLLLIGGKAQWAKSGATFDRLSPISGKVVSRAAAATLEDADAAVAAAQAAFPVWAELSPTERRARLSKAADLMEQRAADFVAVGVDEIGGTPGWYHFNVTLAAGMLREAASMTTQVTGEVIPSDIPGSMAFAVRQPCGVVLGIAPWNAPIILGTRAIAMPLACGNTVILKGSELCPALHRLIGSVLQDANLGDGVVNVILNAREDAPAIVEHLIANDSVRRVNFTGSTAVGRYVGELAGKYLKPALLELGGKAPMIVLDDADLDSAVEAAAFGAFFNQGQICMSTERIIVDKAVADSFVAKLSAKAASLVTDDALKNISNLGAMISGEAAKRVKKLLDDAVSKGAKLVVGGEIDGAVMKPAVVDNVTKQMDLYSEESFGPVVAIVRVGDVEEAIASANDTVFGLSAAVFSKDVSRALRIAKRINSGICHINSSTIHDEPQVPFGGVKASGYGRFGGRAGISEFTDLRWITIQTTPRHYPI
jgi:acyl-CoA reductase-like NAD-dependent aldehyde dehydrogenase